MTGALLSRAQFNSDTGLDGTVPTEGKGGGGETGAAGKRKRGGGGGAGDAGLGGQRTPWYRR